MWVNNELFILKSKDFPVLPPELSEESRLWWKEQFKRCVEGYSVGGKWMPPNLYFYINFWDIEMNVGKSKTKVIARPFLRDIEWLIGNAWIAARGFNGFTDDEYELNNNGIYEKLQNGSLEYKSGKPVYDNESKDLMILGPRDFGKASWSESITYTNQGKKRWGDVKVGDMIYGPDGKLTKVLNVFEQGIQPLYKVTLRDGRSTYCTKEHLWTVNTKNNNKKSRKKVGNFIIKTLKTEELLKNFKINRIVSRKTPNGFEPRYYLQNNEAVEFNRNEKLPLDPYTLGILLGDGCLPYTSANTAQFAMLPEDLENIRKYIPYPIHTIKSSAVNHRINLNNIKDIIKGLNLLDKYSDTKFIPEIYLYSSIEDRLNVLRGLLDTDGSVGKQASQIEYTTISKQLCDNIMWLCRSLGINCTLGTKLLYTGNTAYRVNIFTNKKIFNLERKQNRINKVTNLALSRINKTAIVNIEYAFDDDCRCVILDNDSHLYLIDDFIPTHNSFIASGMIIAHEWIFDGRKSVEKTNIRNKSHIAVGAGETKYSGNLLSKFSQGYTTSILQKSIALGNVLYPHPFSKKYTGTLVAGKDGMIAKYNVKVGGEWTWEGSFSTIRHFSYKNNSFAAQGTRNSVMVKEEIGEFDNYLDTYAHDRETMADGGRKFGSSFEIGTGGNMNKGTIGAYKKFYDPETYDLLTIDDKWENKGKIGMFIPGTMRFNNFKDEQGNTDHEKALEFINLEIDKKKKGKNRKAVLDYIQYNPRVPSEIFLQNVSNIFPVNELQYILSKLETDKRSQSTEYIGELFYNIDGILEYKDNPDLEPIKEYPINKSNSNTGCFIFYEMPYKQQGEIEAPYGMYIAGYDPYFQDESTTDSLGSSFIYNKVTKKIVAEYVGRPETDKKYNENLKKLLKFYNAKCLYENQVKGFFDYLDNTNETFLLADQPDILKDIIQDSKVNRGKGCHMTIPIKEWGERLIRDWLLEPVDDINENLLNLHNLRSIGLIKELIMYNHTGNFDRVMAFMMVMILDKETKRMVFNESKQSNKLMHETGFFSAFNKITENVLHEQ